MANKYEYKDYTQSQRVNDAQAALDQHTAQRPGEYQSQWAGQMDSLMGQIQNRKPFQYNINEDALYNQYKDQYIRNGQLAMQDTMGQAAALTGGYGSSYAQQVGQQAFQGYLQGLNDKVPQLAQMAFDRYNQEGSDLYRQYALLGDREQQDYSRYQDAMNLWMNDRNYLQNVLGDERAFDYGKYQDERGFGYQQYRDQLADEQWQAQFDEAKRQWDQLHPVAAPAAVEYRPRRTPADETPKDEEKTVPTGLAGVAAMAADAKKHGVSNEGVRKYIASEVPKHIPNSSPSVAARIAYEMQKAQGVL